ncbi:MAG: alpha-amylase family glycosyl hydrolase [Erysipelotrichaceae bacterium]
MKKLLVLSLILLAGCASEEPKSIAELEAQVATYDTQSLLEWGSIYEIFPIAFADSDGDKHGDLQGVISKLDYLNDGDSTTTEDLGIGAIWFTPLYPSNSYHHYDVIDYQDIDPKFGSLADFEELVAECDKRGIKIVMDMVFNHTAYEHPWFQKALEGNQKYVDYYRIEESLDKEQYTQRKYWRTLPDGRNYYAWFWERMPELDATNPAVRKEFFAILDFWMDKGVDGFRFDAAKHVFNSDEFPQGTPTMQYTQQFWLEIRDHVKSKNPDTLLISEVWLKTSEQGAYASGFDSMFNFDVGASIMEMVRAGTDKGFVETYLKNQEILLKRSANYIDSPFLTNHDQNRIRSEVENDNQAKLAAMLYLTMPGLPTVYYGEELGMKGVKPDEQIREPMKWAEGCTDGVACWEPYQYNQDTASVLTQQEDETSMLSLYQGMLNFRMGSDILKKGDLQPVAQTQSQLVSYRRTYEGKSAFIVHNLGTTPVTLPNVTGTLAFAHLASLDNQVLTLPAQSSAIVYE